MRQNKKILVLALLIIMLASTAAPICILRSYGATTSAETGWTLITNSRSLKAYPALQESIWQKNATMPPNGQYDKIGLHRLVNPSSPSKGVIFMTDCPTWGSGEEHISNSATDNWTKYENYSQAIYWANRGFDVYAIDYRSHFVPATLNSSQVSFMADWGWDQWISDIKEAAEQVKAVSGASKFFMSGQCTGAIAALNYATKYQSDLRGIILQDPNFGSTLIGYPIVATTGGETNTYNLTLVIGGMKAMGAYAQAGPINKALSQYALQNPGAPAQYPPGTSLTPTVNPLTNKTWTNITEWYAYAVQYATPAFPGMYSNLVRGYGDVTQFEYCMANAELVPTRLFVEAAAMVDWVNCPYMKYDFNDHYKEINVPVLAFAAELFSNRTGNFRFVNGVATTDFTGVLLKNYGHADVYFGTYSARDVSQPALDWMTSHYQPPSASAFCSVTVMTGQTWYFFAHSAGTVGPNTYQWYEGTTMLTGQTSMLLAATKTTAGTYTYTCKVTDAEGTTAASNTVTLTVINK